MMGGKRLRRSGMKICGVVLAAVMGCSVAMAQTPADGGVTVWPKGVPPAGTTVADFGDHTMTISHREVNGKVEVHQTKADIMVVQSGTATLVTGGEVVDPKTTGPNEIQGTSIKGGVSHTLAAGDVVEIPAGVPHQFFIAPGTQITYLIVKVVKK
jgi:mannose-6-phosphate isomerase-like protein (cupin superfamily)